MTQIKSHQYLYDIGGGEGGREEITLENAIGKTHYQVTEWCIPSWNRPYWACSISQWPLPKCEYSGRSG
jgi:hypothetical protein